MSCEPNLTSNLSMPPETNSGLFVQSFARGLEVIEAFGQTPTMTLTELSEATGLSRATVRRFVHTLVHLGYVRATDKHFALTPKIMNLGFAYLASQPLVELVEPVLSNLSKELGQSTSVSVLVPMWCISRGRKPPRSCVSTSPSGPASPPTQRRWGGCC